MTCSRHRDETHATCISCIKQAADTCRTGKRARVPVVAGPAQIEGVRAWSVTGLDVPSPNEWVRHPHGRKVYMGIKAKWKRAVAGSVYHFGQAQGKRSIKVIRWIKDKRSLYDEDNLTGGLKPIIDSLVQEGVLQDDTTGLLRVEKPQQRIGAPRVEVTIKDCD